MKKISLKFENCYGIKNMEHTFDFDKNNCSLIYASNGMMKTSFTKTFRAISLGKKPQDEVFKRTTLCNISKDDGVPIEKEDIFVINSYEDEYISQNTAKLVINRELKEKYDLELLKISSQKGAFLSLIQEHMGGFAEIEKEFTKIFNKLPIDFLECLKVLWTSSSAYIPIIIPFNRLDYADIISEDVQKFVSDPKNMSQIVEYSQRYDELISASPIFKRGVFSHYNAEELSSSLMSNGFFEANHKLVFDGNDTQITSKESYNNFIDKERNKIFEDEKLKKKFDKIDKALSKRALQSFRKAIEIMPEIIPMLEKYEELKQNIWITIFKSYENEVQLLLELYQESNEIFTNIKETAKTEKTQWDNVVEIFKERFSVPFNIQIPNIDEVLLNDQPPQFDFKYQELSTYDEIAIERKTLEKVLSQGEKRALYLLNIIYDLEALKMSNREVLVIADDISDSFDYKNKYAIIEYLQELISETKMKFIILTHNFDFYRTSFSRLEKVRPYMVIKNNNGVSLVDPKYLKKNPFALLRGGMQNNNDADIITAIPFVRNIIEYISDYKNDSRYNKLTELLHMKDNTLSITIKELEDIFNSILDTNPLSFSNGRESETVYSIITNQAKEFVLRNSEEVSLDGKIILSIASRLLAEQYMIASIIAHDGNDDKVNEIRNSGSFQTAKLFNEYKQNHNMEIEGIKVLNKVMLMTSENIHVNSFMFEPIIDMSSSALIDIYGKLKIFTQ